MSPMAQWLYNHIEFFIVCGVIPTQFFTEEGNWVFFLTEYSTYANAWSVAHNFEHLGEIRKFMTGASVICCLIFFEQLGSGYRPLKLFSLQAIRNWGHDSAESLYESLIECRQPMKASYFSNILELRPFYNRLDFLRISWNPLSWYNKSQEYDPVSHEHTLLRVCI